MASYRQDSAVTLIIIVLIVLIVAFFTWKVISKNQVMDSVESSAAISLNTKAGQSPYTDIDGNTVNLSDYIGKVLVVNSWASWCPGCSVELKKIAGVLEQYNDDQVIALAINRSEPSTTAISYLRSVDNTGRLRLIMDPEDRYFNSIGGYNMPETIIYDRNGNIVLHKHDSVSTIELKDKIDKSLKE